ncbi:MAG: alpha/beta hydrolase [Nitrospirae bacterium]|nr:alpha/beta hydrolase [Nitrospirota bacterium]
MKPEPFTFQDSRSTAWTGMLSSPDVPTEKVVILGHGFLSHQHSRTNRRLTDHLVSQKIATLRFNWDGMGDSPSRFADITVGKCCHQLEEAIAALHASHYARIGVIGSSFGGLITTLVGGNNPSIHAIGLKCPVVDFPTILRNRLGEQGMDQWRKTNTIPNPRKGLDPIPLNFFFLEECTRYNALMAATHIQAPTRIVHGDQDETVPLEQAQSLFQSIQTQKDLATMKGANHQFDQPEDFENMTMLLTQWIKEHL